MITFSSTYGNIQMPNPILGDADQFNLGTIYKIAMDNTIHSTKQNRVISTFLLTFDNINQLKYEEFMTWFTSSRGLRVLYVDYNAVIYFGMIKNQPLEITIDGRRYCDHAPSPDEFEKATITIEFEAQR